MLACLIAYCNTIFQLLNSYCKWNLHWYGSTDTNATECYGVLRKDRRSHLISLFLLYCDIIWLTFLAVCLQQEMMFLNNHWNILQIWCSLTTIGISYKICRIFQWSLRNIISCWCSTCVEWFQCRMFVFVVQIQTFYTSIT